MRKLTFVLLVFLSISCAHGMPKKNSSPDMAPQGPYGWDGLKSEPFGPFPLPPAKPKPPASHYTPPAAPPLPTPASQGPAPDTGGGGWELPVPAPLPIPISHPKPPAPITEDYWHSFPPPHAGYGMGPGGAEKYAQYKARNERVEQQLRKLEEDLIADNPSWKPYGYHQPHVFGTFMKDQRLAHIKEEMVARDARNFQKMCEENQANYDQATAKMRTSLDGIKSRQEIFRAKIVDIKILLESLKEKFEPEAYDVLSWDLTHTNSLFEAAVETVQLTHNVDAINFYLSTAQNFVDTLNSFLGGVASGVHGEFVTLSQTLEAVYNNPTLITNMANNFMRVISSHHEVSNVAWKFIESARLSLIVFENTMKYGTAEQKGQAIGQLGANILLTLSGEGLVVHSFKSVPFLRNLSTVVSTSTTFGRVVLERFHTPSIRSEVTALRANSIAEMELLRGKKVSTHVGDKFQELSQAALEARTKIIQMRAKVYRVGTRGRTHTGPRAQFWAFENPALEKELKGNLNDFARRYGIPPENVAAIDFVEIGYVKTYTNAQGIYEKFITRKAEPIGTNPGGAIEVIVPENGVVIEGHISL